MINEQIKEEFRRFFEYAFKFNPQYWQEIPSWEVLGRQAARTQKDAATLNRFISSIITSEQHLKRIISDSNLDSAQELKYYAYLFLKDMGKAEGLPELKLPEAPEQFVGSYDNPNRLLEIVLNQSKSPELRQQALKRIKEIVLWSNLPATIFDREVFNRKKWDEMLVKTLTPRNLIYGAAEDFITQNCKGEKPKDMVDFLENKDKWGIPRDVVIKNVDDVYLGYIQSSDKVGNCIDVRVPEGLREHGKYKSIDRDLCLNKIQEYARCSGWDAVRLYVEGYVKATDEKPIVYNEVHDFTKDQAPKKVTINGVTVEGADEKKFNEDAGKHMKGIIEYKTSKKLQEIVAEKWQKYRKEQDKEYPTLLAQYEKSLEPARFPEHAVTETEDISGDKRYVILRDKLGEAKANELWSSHEKLLDAISGKFSTELKNIFASRLCDISIITADERNKIQGWLGESYEYMFWGDSMNIQVIDPSITRVGKNELFAEQPDQDKAKLTENHRDTENHKENEDL